MTRKLIKLNWTRPKTVKFPKIWRLFEAREVDSDKIIEYRIQDIPESRYEDALNHLEAYYLKYEPVSQALGGYNDPQYVSDYRMVCRSILQQKSSFACISARSDQIVGVHTQYVLTKADSFGKQAYERSQSPKYRSMYDLDAVLTRQFNVFDSYGVGKYLYLHNLAVDKRFRGFNIGLQMLDASKNFCRECNIELMHGIFTSKYSSRIGDDLGFNIDLAISFDDINKARPESGIKNIDSKEMALKSFVL